MGEGSGDAQDEHAASTMRQEGRMTMKKPTRERAAQAPYATGTARTALG